MLLLLAYIVNVSLLLLFHSVSLKLIYVSVQWRLLYAHLPGRLWCFSARMHIVDSKCLGVMRANGALCDVLPRATKCHALATWTCSYCAANPSTTMEYSLLSGNVATVFRTMFTMGRVQINPE